MRLQRLHLSSSPCPQTLAINFAFTAGFAAIGRVVYLRRRAGHPWSLFRLNEIENDY